MMVTLLYQKTKVTIDVLELDASLSENHTGAVEVTDHPVEQGANITDHRRVKPDALVIEGIVSNSPLPDPTAPLQLQEYNGQQFFSRSTYEAGRAETAYQQLLDLLNSPALINVVTALRSYENMTMTDLSVPRDAKSGQAVRFTATFREIIVVQNQTVSVQTSTPRGQRNKDLSKKTATPTDDNTKGKTLAKYGKDSVNKILNDPNFSADPVGTMTKVLFGGH